MERASIALSNAREKNWMMQRLKSNDFPVFAMKGGALLIPPEEYGQFLDYLAADLARLASGATIEPMTLCECRSSPLFRFHVDINMRSDKHPLDADLVKVAQDVLSPRIPHLTHDENTGLPVGSAVVCECGIHPDVPGVVRRGIHIYWPALLVSATEGREIVRAFRAAAKNHEDAFDEVSMGLRMIGMQRYVSCPEAINGGHCHGECGRCDHGMVLSPYRYWPVKILDSHGAPVEDMDTKLVRTLPNLRALVRWTSTRV